MAFFPYLAAMSHVRSMINTWWGDLQIKGSRLGFIKILNDFLSIISILQNSLTDLEINNQLSTKLINQKIHKIIT